MYVLFLLKTYLGPGLPFFRLIIQNSKNGGWYVIVLVGV